MNFFDEACGSTSNPTMESDSKVNLQTKVNEEKFKVPKCFKHERLAIKFPGEVSKEQPEDAFLGSFKGNVSQTQVPAENCDVDLIDFGEDESDEIERIRRPGVKCKITPAEKKRRLNRKISKQFMPKNALILLHELKPGCTFKIVESRKTPYPLFNAEVEFNDTVLGKGEGPSKSSAKLDAAEEAVRELITKTLIKLNAPEVVFNQEYVLGSFEDLPWTAIASYAIFKLFSQWRRIINMNTLPTSSKETKVYLHFLEMFSVDTEEKKELPPDALEMHPVMLLNHLYPGLTAIELERCECPCRVTVGYEINGKMYSGIGGNKKDAKKEAAKAVLKELHGVIYSPSPP